MYLFIYLIADRVTIASGNAGLCSAERSDRPTTQSTVLGLHDDDQYILKMSVMW